MKTNVNWYMFSDWFFQSDTYKNNFSYEGLRALYDYLIDYEDSTGEEIDFDPIALCCEYNEYDSLKDIKNSYNDIKSRQDLENNTQVIDCENGHLIIQVF